MAAESDESPASRAVLIFFAVIALYVLSIGPVARYGGYVETIPMWMQYPYFPLAWAVEHCNPVDKALDWYCDLWKVER